MPVTIRIANFEINGRFTMDWADVPNSLAAFLLANPDTIPLEERGRASPVVNPPDFVRDVCLWGGRRGPPIASKVRNSNNPAALVDSISGAQAAANPLAALNEVLIIHELGVSFGTKVLRFLKPEEWSVYDTLLEGSCWWNDGKSPIARLYPQVCEDFQKIAAYMNILAAPNPIDAAYVAQDQPNPRGGPNVWWTADVEAAVFWKVKLKEEALKKAAKAQKSKNQKGAGSMSSRKNANTPTANGLPAGQPGLNNRSDLVALFIDWLSTRNPTIPIIGFGRGRAFGGHAPFTVVVAGSVINFQPASGGAHTIDVNDPVIDQVFWEYFSYTTDAQRYQLANNQYRVKNRVRDPYIAKAVNAWAHR